MGAWAWAWENARVRGEGTPAAARDCRLAPCARAGGRYSCPDAPPPPCDRGARVSQGLLAGRHGITGLIPMVAHAFGKRYDLPVPLWLFVFGGAAVVFLS